MLGWGLLVPGADRQSRAVEVERGLICTTSLGAGMGLAGSWSRSAEQSCREREGRWLGSHVG